jgi:hypothetical protein
MYIVLYLEQPHEEFTWIGYQDNPVLCKRLVCHITNNVPVVYLARDVMILMLAYPSQGPSERAGPEMATSKQVPFGPKKVEIFRAHPFASNEFANIKIIYKNRYIGNFM